MIFEQKSELLRPMTIETHFTCHAEGSALIKMGQTWVLTTATVEEKVPSFLERRGKGWITAEYAMLPRATTTRSHRESRSGKVSGRSHEIQRLIGRSLRACIDTAILGERTIIIDCDVLQADGGTRVASINGGFIAMGLALQKLVGKGKIKENPLLTQVAAISTGLKGQEILLDLDYAADSSCDVDMNVVMTSKGELVEVQGTAERGTFTIKQNQAMLEKAALAISSIFEFQRKILNDCAA